MISFPFPINLELEGVDIKNYFALIAVSYEGTNLR